MCRCCEDDAFLLSHVLRAREGGQQGELGATRAKAEEARAVSPRGGGVSPMTCELYTRRDPLCTNMSHDYNLRACPLTCRQASSHKFAHGALLFRLSCFVNPHLLFIYVCILHFLAVTPPSILFHEHTPRFCGSPTPQAHFNENKNSSTGSVTPSSTDLFLPNSAEPSHTPHSLIDVTLFRSAPFVTLPTLPIDHRVSSLINSSASN